MNIEDESINNFRCYFLVDVLGMDWSKIGWYLFFEPSSINDAEQTIRKNNCDSFDSSFIGIQLECKAAYDYIRKNRENH